MHIQHRERQHIMLRRRRLELPLIAWFLFRCALSFSAEVPSKPPFRVLYNNDLTHVTTCASPWHPKGAAFKPEMLEASVDEAAGIGVDVHLLAPGLCEVPWWPSKVRPLAEHAAWIKQTYGLQPDGFSRFVLDGGDFIKLFVDRCRKTGQHPFISFRLNDAHHKEYVDNKPGSGIPGSAMSAVSQFYHDHPEYRIGTDVKRAVEHVLNWAIPEVRAHKFELIQELCENYDLDGFELDYLRFPSFFQLDKTPPEQRRSIMTAFIKDVRNLLDRTAKPGQHRWLCVRIPCFLAAHEPMGIDVKEFADAGVDMFNLSPYYVFEQQNDSAAIKRLVPNAAVYVEMTQTTRPGPKAGNGYDDFTFRRTTAEQFETTAHLAYARGLDGVSAFNFVYFREHGTPFRGPFNEPPFDVLKHLGDPAWLAQRPQHYFLTCGYDAPKVPHRQLGHDHKMVSLGLGRKQTFSLDLAPPVGGWKSDGRLRIQSVSTMKENRITATFNGVELTSSNDVSEPYPGAHPALLGTAETLRAWTVPAGLMRDGANRIEMTMNSGDPAEVIFLDLAVSSNR